MIISVRSHHITVTTVQTYRSPQSPDHFEVPFQQRRPLEILFVTTIIWRSHDTEKGSFGRYTRTIYPILPRETPSVIPKKSLAVSIDDVLLRLKCSCNPWLPTPGKTQHGNPLAIPVTVT